MYNYVVTSTEGTPSTNDKPSVAKGLSDILTDDIPNELEAIEKMRNKLLEHEGNLLEKGLQSNNPDVLIKAQSHWNDVKERQSSGMKTQVFDPNQWATQSQGYKGRGYSLSFNMLRRMAKTPIIRSIITTRQAQIGAFSSPQRSRFDTGFVIRKKSKFYTDQLPEMTEADKVEAQRIADFLLNGGQADNQWHGDNFDTFLKKFVEDCLTLDQGTFEIVRDRKGDPVEFLAVDAATMRIADSIDDDDYDEEGSANIPREKERGYYPSYVQLIDGAIVAEYYPWELCFAVRNATTDIRNNGYGRSEIEDLIDIITWMLYGDAYNGKFFSQGASPKGMLKVSGNVNRNRLNEFRQEWLQMVAGVMNAWKIPVIESDKMEWIDMQKNNTDMQFGNWQEYLIKVGCAMFKIAPEEIGFNMSSGNAMQESDPESRLKFSRDKGLKPLMKSIEFWINKYLIKPLNEEFEFKFAGIDLDSEEKELEQDIKRVGSFAGFKEIRKKWGLEEDFAEGDFPLNPAYIQRIGAIEMAEQQEAMMGGQEEEEDVWGSLGEDLAKGIPGHEDNPMMADLLGSFVRDFNTNRDAKDKS